MTGFRHVGLALMLAGQTVMLQAQIAVSANDGKAVPTDMPDSPRTADTIAVLEIRRAGVRRLATLPVPGTVAGPPGTVAMSADSRLAIITAGQMLDDARALAPADIVSVIDLRDPRTPRLVQTLHAGAGAAGVAINPAGNLALVANTNADSLSVFTIANRRLTSAGTIALDPKSRPVDLAFADGRTVYVVAQGTHRLLRFTLRGTQLTPAREAVALGAGPYSLALNPRRQLAYVSHLGGRAPSTAPGPKPGSIGIVDLKAGRMVGQVDTGVTPEHVGLSPSGDYLQVTVNNGSTLPANAPAFHDFGRMTIYRTEGFRLTPIAETRTGRWCQGAVWRADEAQILLQCARDKQIELYAFDGHALTPGTPIAFDARPGAIATARSR